MGSDTTDVSARAAAVPAAGPGDEPIVQRYTPPTSFAQVPLADVAHFIARRALCTLIVLAPTGLVSAHVPVVLKHGRLEGHVARRNLAFAALGGSLSGLAIFQREQDYGLPQVARIVDDTPFGAVHLHGRLTMVDDPAFVRENIRSLSEHHLAARIHPWNAIDLPDDFRDVLAGKTVGLTFAIDRVEACHAYLREGQGRTDGIVDIDPRAFTSPNCRPVGA